MIDRLRNGFFLLLSFFAGYVIFTNIYGSWSAPPPQTRLDRLQTDLVLQALTNDRVQNIIGNELTKALYRQSLNEYLAVKDQSKVIIQVGLLYIKNEQPEKALTIWSEDGDLSQALRKLWLTQPDILPNTEDLIKQNLEGWYKYYALHRFYELTRPQFLSSFELQQTIEAEAAVLRLLLINLIPIVGTVIGLVVLVFYLIKLRQQSQIDWVIPWSLETVWQVVVSWFCCYTLIAQFLPLVLRRWLDNSSTSQALVVALTYLSSMIPIIPIFAVSLRGISGWQKIIFNFSQTSLKSIAWTMGGYFVAVPLVVITSLVQQLILRERGGGNPLLEIIIESQSNLSILIFWVTLGVSAPLFEEILFRGFLFPSLTKYFSPQLALIGSAFLFALVHMNINDILPLTMLGIVLGETYLRSRSLLTPILLHSLWNTGSLVSLLLLRP